jgi:hypothetical protein
MSKSNSFENSLLKLIFNGETITGIARNATASVVTSVYVALHSSDPGEAGNQTTNELAYTSYARVGVARTTAAWTVTTCSVSPAAAITFPACTGSSGTAAYFSIGTATSAAGVILYSGTVTPNIVITTGVTPALSVLTAITEA